MLGTLIRGEGWRGELAGECELMDGRECRLSNDGFRWMEGVSGAVPLVMAVGMVYRNIQESKEEEEWLE